MKYVTPCFVVFVVCLLLSAQVWAEMDHVPMSVNFVFDVSEEASQEEVQQAYDFVAGFVKLMHVRAHAYSEAPSDWVAVRWSVDDYQYDGVPFLAASDCEAMDQLYEMLRSQDHSDKQYATSTFGAIVQGTNQLVEHAAPLPDSVWKSVILITDSHGTDVSHQARIVVERSHPVDIPLFVVKLGALAAQDEFQGITPNIFSIEQFGQFLGNLVRMREMLPEMKRRIEGA